MINMNNRKKTTIEVYKSDLILAKIIKNEMNINSMKDLFHIFVCGWYTVNLGIDIADKLMINKVE